jgi:rubrerythrin
MTRFALTLVIIIVFLVALRRLFASSLPRGDSASRPPAKRAPRGAPRSLVCGDCGTQFEPGKEGWVCPSCGK